MELPKYGAHLLGRYHEPDERDWTIGQLLAATPTPDASLLDKTIREVIADGTYFSHWRYFLIFWRFIKAWIHANPPTPSPSPTPPPSPDPSPTVTSKLWPDPIQLDQGQTGHCVGFGWAAWGDTDPIDDGFQDVDGHAIYYQAKVIDGQPLQENGSSVRSGAKAMQNRGRLSGYAFSTSLDEIKQWVLTRGPVTIGTDWLMNMFYPDAEGFIRPTGSVEGGHCYLMKGYDSVTDVFTFKNSWGSDWGVNGDFKMHATEFASLLQNGGEACVALENPLQ